MRPLEIIEEAPIEVAQHRHTVRYRLTQRTQIAVHVVLPIRVRHFAVQTDRIVGIHAVFGNQNRRMIALIEEARPPVQPVFIDGPFQGVMRMTRRVAHMLRLAVRPLRHHCP